ncbi:AAA-like domain-containing protein [Hyalangium gracile]|uniref:AAA-like domain-containing protein n=1 Tax=Hyalangium gracile TaxID=394092 RepID=UPI001CCF3619|nr:AAA-like domain-containing protein [Hyalangium gracile]
MDIQHRHPQDQWPYEQEELALTCLVHTSLFTHEPLGEQSIVLHRFGGSYGPAAFLLTAKEFFQKGAITLSFVNRHGMTVHTVVLPNIEIVAEPAAEAPDFMLDLPRFGEEEVAEEILGEDSPPEEVSQGSEDWVVFSGEISPRERERMRNVLSPFREYLILNGVVEEPIPPMTFHFPPAPKDRNDRREWGYLRSLLSLKDTLTREYAHHVLKRRQGEAPTELASVESGLADYLVCSFKNDPHFGQEEARLQFSKAPFLRNLDNRLRFTRPQDPTAPGVWEIWGGVFWELRQHFGAQVIDELVVQAWRATKDDFPRALLRRMAQRSFEKFEKTGEVLLERGVLSARDYRDLLSEAIQPVELSLPPLAIERPEAHHLLKLISALHGAPIIRVEGYYGQASATLLRLVGLLGERLNVPMQFFLFDVPSRLPLELRPDEFLELFTTRIEDLVREVRYQHPEWKIVVGIGNFHRLHTLVGDVETVNSLQDRLTRQDARLLLACRPDTPFSHRAEVVRLQDLDGEQVRNLCWMYGVSLSEEGEREFLHWTGGSLHLAEIALQGARQHEWTLEELMRFESVEWSRIFDGEMARVRQWLAQQSPVLTTALREVSANGVWFLERDVALPLMGQGLICESERDSYTLRTPLYLRALWPDTVARLPHAFWDRLGGHRWSLDAWQLASRPGQGLRLRLVLQSHDAKKDPIPKSVHFMLTRRLHKHVRSVQGRAIADFSVGASFGPTRAYAEMELKGERYRLSLPIDDISQLPKNPRPKKKKKAAPKDARKK